MTANELNLLTDASTNPESYVPFISEAIPIDGSHDRDRTDRRSAGLNQWLFTPRTTCRSIQRTDVRTRHRQTVRSRIVATGDTSDESQTRNRQADITDINYLLVNGDNI